MIGKWIDGLSDEQRDRIVSATEWGFSRVPMGHPDSFDSATGKWCLMAHAEGRSNGWMRDEKTGMADPAHRFDELCERFGLARIVRAIKARAAATTTAEVAAAFPASPRTIRTPNLTAPEHARYQPVLVGPSTRQMEVGA